MCLCANTIVSLLDGRGTASSGKGAFVLNVPLFTLQLDDASARVVVCVHTRATSFRLKDRGLVLDTDDGEQ